MKTLTITKTFFLITFYLILTVVILSIAIIGWRFLSSNENTTNVFQFEEQLETIKIEHEKELEKMFNSGYDQGYQDAVWDIYFGNPLYIVEDTMSEDYRPTLWKRMEVSDEHKKRIEEYMNQKINLDE
jgi:hypothetical protein